MSLLVTGYSYPRLIIDPTGRDRQTIDLPLCKEGGLQENWQEQYILHEELDLLTKETTLSQEIIGWRGIFTLDYSSYAVKNDLLNIKTIIDEAKQGSTLLLFPRVDQLSRYYEVKYTSPAISLGISRGGSNAFHKNLTLEFQTTNLVTSVPFINIDDTIIPFDEFIGAIA